MLVVSHGLALDFLEGFVEFGCCSLYASHPGTACTAQPVDLGNWGHVHFQQCDLVHGWFGIASYHLAIGNVLD